jgi:PAS domain S-box-containing protein
MSSRPSLRFSNARWLRKHHGVGVVFATVVLLEILRQLGIAAPNPQLFTALAITYAAYSGGYAGGLAGAAVGVAYALYFFSSPGDLFQYSAINRAKVIVNLITLPGIAVLVSRLNYLLSKSIRSQVDQTLQETESRLRDFAEAGVDRFWECDKNQRFTYRWHQARGRKFLPEEAFIGKTWWEIHHTPECKASMDAFKPVLERHAPFRNVLIRISDANGTARYRRVSGKPLVDDDGKFKGYRGVVSDVTDEVLTQQSADRLRLESELLRKIVATANETSDTYQAMQVCLDEVCALTGWPVGHAYILNNDRGRELVPTDLWHLDNEEAFAEFRRVTEETNFMEGIGLPGRVLANRAPEWITDVNEDDTFLRTVPAGECGIKCAVAIPVLAGSKVMAVLEFFSTEALVPDDHVLDILSQAGTQIGRVAERQEAEQKLHQAQKMEVVGQLTGGVAHDFNNLLAVIMGNAELLADNPKNAAALVDNITRSAQRGAELTQHLLAFSRKQPLHPRVVNMSDIVAKMRTLLDRTLGTTIEISSQVAPDLWQALADPGQLENALLNLAINARDAMPGGGTLTIRCANTHFDEDDLGQNVEVEAGDYVMEDTGQGMTANVLEHAFEPFYTTKDVGEGSGLGLSMVYGFSKQSRGHVTIDSKPGRGTTVRLYLPRTTTETAAQEQTEVAEFPRGRGETVLVVEDDPDVRELVKVMIDSLGYSVITASTAAAARAALESEDIDLVLSDVVLPGGVNGPTFVREACGPNPGLRVIFMSGYPAGAAGPDSGLGLDDVLINKPFKKKEIAATLHEALN